MIWLCLQGSQYLWQPVSEEDQKQSRFSAARPHFRRKQRLFLSMYRQQSSHFLFGQQHQVKQNDRYGWMDIVLLFSWSLTVLLLKWPEYTTLLQWPAAPLCSRPSGTFMHHFFYFVDLLYLTRRWSRAASFLCLSHRHDMQTGRWLSKLSAVWDPKQEDCFVVGSMMRPRRVQVFHESGRLLHSFMDSENLNTVLSVTAFHPTRNAVLGGNASGRLHVFAS